MKKLSRTEAIKISSRHYFTGKSCKHGHVNVRYVSDFTCVDCRIKQRNTEYHQKYMKQYHKDNKNSHNTQCKKRYQIHKERHLYVSKVWYETHKEQHKEYVKQYGKLWRKNNPDKTSLSDTRRCKAIKQSAPLWYENDLVKQFYLKRDELNKKWGTNFQVDHIIPIVSDTVCGLHCWDNLQLLDKSLNSSKRHVYEQNW